MTKGDSIRNMSDEEFADKLARVMMHVQFLAREKHRVFPSVEWLREQILKNMKEEI